MLKSVSKRVEKLTKIFGEFKDAQQWLDQQFLNQEERKNIKEINITEQLQGELDVSDFTYKDIGYSGVRIFLHPNINHSKLKIINKPNGSEITQLKDVQKWLEKNYPKNGVCSKDEIVEDKEIITNNRGKKRSEITEIYAIYENLLGSLDISDFTSLKYLWYSNNQLTELIISKHNKLKRLDLSKNKLINLDVSECVDLEWLDCNDNKLTQLILPDNNNLKELNCSENELINLDITNYSNLNLKKLTCSGSSFSRLILPIFNQLEFVFVNSSNLVSFDYSTLNSDILNHLNVSNNNLNPIDISVFSHLVNLNYLDIENNKIWIEKGNKGNQFYGSLKSLQNLARLSNLYISNTHVNEGLEYLPESLRTFHYSSLENSNWKVKEIENKLKSQIFPNERFDNFNWKTYLTRMIKDEQIKTLEEENIKIEGLEDDILRLTNLTQEQRQKILNAYLKFAPNKPLLKELITTCLEYQKAKKNNKLTPKELKFLRKKLEEIRNNLEEEVGEELFEEINSIINDCEDLVRWELELENEIIRRKLLLNDAYQKVISLEINIKKIEASDNAQVYIGNIINNHKQLDKYDKYITNNFDFVNNNDNSTNYLGSEINHYQEILPK